MRALPLVVALGGLICACALLLVMGSHRPVPTPATASARPAAMPEAPVAGAVSAPARAVAGDLVPPPEVGPETLERIAPRAALSRFSQPLPPKRRNAGRIFRPAVVAAGIVTGAGLEIRIAGLTPTAVDARCTDRDGVDWPCGMRARTAFRSFVRGRALACDLPEELTEKSYRVACALGSADIGAWLVRQGWARPLPEGPYADPGREAEAAALGIYGVAPSTAAPVEIPPDVLAAGAAPDNSLPNDGSGGIPRLDR